MVSPDDPVLEVSFGEEKSYTIHFEDPLTLESYDGIEPELVAAGLEVTVAIQEDLRSYVSETGTCDTFLEVGKATCTIKVDAKNLNITS